VSNARRIRRQLAEGRAICLVPPIPDDASPALKNALAIRNAASASGRCACGAEGRIVGPDEDGALHLRFEHEDDCTATDGAIAEILRREA